MHVYTIDMSNQLRSPDVKIYIKTRSLYHEMKTCLFHLANFKVKKHHRFHHSQEQPLPTIPTSTPVTSSVITRICLRSDYSYDMHDKKVIRGRCSNTSSTSKHYIDYFYKYAITMNDTEKLLDAFANILPLTRISMGVHM
ncbi:hypothetical protein BDC45DRAFT_541462 [Circinella umbellata]|nr:hypothetical protein BDC45DRAFT_541462 [Circinella umbellata]